ncbi:hypothetical protein [Sulfurimonas sp.]|jgi:hypothetical protein|uniref:hypothetical protein n=1 Tax=Sulfurimonas sp. TaxID=2022749 RepID=UPI0025F1DE48|nr:hypothetical protein [Sulfurimonas sp.]MCK9473795.1 hypothetical protein [Sulfurimonas sp.]MDD3505446.1 hypothetical protein [Sulfurimonas sp.]
MIGKFLETLYTKVFINIIVENSQTVVYVEECSRNEVLQSTHKVFETTSINSKMQDFIRAFFKQTPFYYVSILDKSSNQGAIPTCTVSEMGKYCDINSSEYICFSEHWAYYTSEYDLEAIKHEYRSIGLDFIFSPFALMATFFKDKIGSTLAMFVLVEDSYISFSIFDKSRLLYGEYLDMQHHKDDEEMLIDSSLEYEDDTSLGIDGIDLEDMSIEDDVVSFDDFADIEDLDSDNSMDEFSEIQEIHENIEHEVDISTEGFNEDYQRFSLIQSALKTFYKDPKYESQFIETIYIADGARVSSDLKSYLEEEMFLNVYVRKIDLGVVLCEMAKAEVNEI